MMSTFTLKQELSIENYTIKLNKASDTKYLVQIADLTGKEESNQQFSVPSDWNVMMKGVVISKGYIVVLIDFCRNTGYTESPIGIVILYNYIIERCFHRALFCNKGNHSFNHQMLEMRKDLYTGEPYIVSVVYGWRDNFIKKHSPFIFVHQIFISDLGQISSLVTNYECRTFSFLCIHNQQRYLLVKKNKQILVAEKNTWQTLPIKDKNIKYDAETQELITKDSHGTHVFSFADQKFCFIPDD